MSLTRAEAFQLLQVQPDATEGAIKAAYRRLALRYHPDKNIDNDAAKHLFQRINAAYNLLTSEEDVLSEDQIVSLFQDLIRTDWFSFLAQNYDFSDDSDYYDSDEEQISVEQWEQIEKAAQNNAQKLVEEEEQGKKKLEKKRERRKKHKQRRKEKKRGEKEGKCEGSNGTEKYEIRDVTNIQIIKKGSDPAEALNRSREHVSDTDSSSPEIDLGSAFCSKVKQKVEKSEARTRRASEKASSNGDETSARRPTPPQGGASITVTTKPSGEKKPPEPLPEPPSEENFFKSQEHARKGNEFAQAGQLQSAIEEYSRAISLNKIDHRCYGNRSYCYHSLKKFDDALKDANSAISLVPNELKGYFRKAKALCGLKRFSEAENALKKILELDAECSEAAHELFEVRLLQLQDFGFDRRACEHALIKSKNDIQGAIEFLLSSQFKDNMSFTSADYEDAPTHPPQMGPPIYPNITQFQQPPVSTYFPVIPTGTYTASPMRLTAVAPGTRPNMVPAPGNRQTMLQGFHVPYPQNMALNANMMRMSAPMANPVRHHSPNQHGGPRPNTMAVRPGPRQTSHQNGHLNEKRSLPNGRSGKKFDPRDYSLWVGHFDPKKITDRDLYESFSSFGKVSGVVIIKTHGKPLAYSFIHFMAHEEAARAFASSQNHVVKGQSLDVNWNKNPTIECEHWLRGNCPYSNCHYLHVRDHQTR